MNKKEVLEIKKQFSPANCAITRICGCYVNHEKEQITNWKSAFLSLPEEEEFKYFELFKKTLSGSIGKNLLHMEFPLEQEAEGGTQEFLMKLRNSKLQDDSLIQEFYEKIIGNYEYPENYYIILIHAVYDIPGQASDGFTMDDASDNVYEHILCSICPMTLSKPGLSYNPEHNTIQERVRDWIVEAPLQGFLFPAFTDRNTDIHGVLYYSKKSEELKEEFIEEMLGSRIPLSAGSQKDHFNLLLEDALGEECDYEVVRNVHENLNGILDENQDNPDPIELSKPDVRRLLQESGVGEEQLENFDQHYDGLVGEKNHLMVSNITENRKFQIQTPDVVIKVNPERADLIETRVIDGRHCLVIAVDDHIEVNGVNARTIAREEMQQKTT